MEPVLFAVVGFAFLTCVSDILYGLHEREHEENEIARLRVEVTALKTDLRVLKVKESNESRSRTPVGA